MSLNMERMFELHDGDHSHPVKRSKGKRVDVSNALLNMVTFTVPQRFLTEIWCRKDSRLPQSYFVPGSLQRGDRSYGEILGKNPGMYVERIRTLFLNKFIQSTTSTSKHDPPKCPQQFTGIHGG